jgi:hypothetical protein
LKKIVLEILILFVFPVSIFAQARDTSKYEIGRIINGDTIIERQLKEIWVFPGRGAKNKRQEANFWKYVYKVRKVYPYAKRANELLKKYEPEYLGLTKQHDRRKLIKKVEDELLDQYKEDLKKMTMSEGRILIKLIDRETGRTSYTIIKDFRGSFSAFFWQTLAKLFGNDLKSEYDGDGEDRLIEEIVRMIEAGQL